MANPNRVLANLPKRPYAYVQRCLSEVAAEELRDQLRADGWDAKVTTVVEATHQGRNRPKLRRTVFNVWKREKQTEAAR